MKTIKAITFSLACLSFLAILLSFKNLSKEKPINEPLHLFYTERGIEAKWIENGELRQALLGSKNVKSFEKKFNIQGLTSILNEGADYQSPNTDEQQFIQDHQNVKSFVAVSDLHGQFNLFISLLQKHDVIDQANNWSFGEGHLVIVGDVVDRGDQVTEALWMIYKLEQQAEEAGGKVHYVIGNHELMIFDNDLRYIHKKYFKVAESFGAEYDELFSNRTFFGRWLRRKPVMISINEALFTHGGISPAFISRGFSPQQANQLFVDSIFTQEKKKYRESADLNFLSRTEGPLWYRGYFLDQAFTKDSLANILTRLGKKRIVVGHTSHPTLVSKFDHRIFGIDSSIKNGRSGELLIFENHQYYRGTLNGERIFMN